MRLLVSQEVGRQRWQIIRPGIGISLPSRSIKLEDDDSSAPRFGSRTRSDVVDGAIDGSVA